MEFLSFSSELGLLRFDVVVDVWPEHESLCGRLGCLDVDHKRPVLERLPRHQVDRAGRRIRQIFLQIPVLHGKFSIQEN